jgi:hypothetical protein
MNGLRVWESWLGGSEEAAVVEALAGCRLPAVAEFRLVQLYGGLAAGSGAAEQDARADGLPARINQRHGREVACVHRPFDRTFPVWREPRHGLFAGGLPGGRQALVAMSVYEELFLAVFDGHGNLVDTQGRALKGILREPEDTYDYEHGGELLDYLRREFAFEPGMIGVHEFATAGGLSVHLWPYFDEILADPDTTPDWMEGRLHVCDSVYRWLQRGNFVIDWGNDYWAGPDGVIHSS